MLRRDAAPDVSGMLRGAEFRAHVGGVLTRALLDGLVTPERGSGAVRDLREWFDMSDGTLRALGILVAIFQSPGGEPGKVPLVAIEEPEIALHPAAAGVLRDSLRDASQTTQLIVTSHSPDLLDDPSISPEAILAVANEGGSTQIAPPDAASRQALLDRLYTPGDLLRMNRLVPDIKAAVAASRKGPSRPPAAPAPDRERDRPSVALDILRPIRQSRERLVKLGELERAGRLAAMDLQDEGAILVVVDSERPACPAEEGPRLLARLREAVPAHICAVVLAHQEMETWFIAAARSLAGRRGLRPDLEPPQDPESVRGAKEWLSRHMPRGRVYSESLDQPAFAAVMDLQQARSADSFDSPPRRSTKTALPSVNRHGGEGTPNGA